jgi:hypothetical protein
MDEAIAVHQQVLLIGERTAEAIKITRQCFPLEEPLDGCPRSNLIRNSEDDHDDGRRGSRALSDAVSTIINAVRVAEQHR